MTGNRRASLVLALALLSACSNSDAPPSGNPADQLGTDRFGYKVGEGVAVGQNITLSWVKNVVSGYAPPNGESPAKIGWLETTRNCAFPKPAGGDRLVQVHANESWAESDIFAISKSDILDRAQNYVALWQRRGEDPGVNSNRSGDRLKVVDVVVTETRQPVYLVLTGGHSILWNVHKAGNARISRVAIVGAGDAGIANLDPDIPVSVLAGSAAKKCQVAAFRRPQPFWDVVERANKGDQISAEAVESRKNVFAKYDRWFRTNFGNGSEAVTVGIDRMSHAVIGPMPMSRDARVPYRGFAGSTVRLAPADHAFFAASSSDYDAIHGDLVRKQAQQLAGGDLAMLNKN